MFDLLLIPYILLGFFWIGLCLDRGSIIPRTYGDFVISFIALPFTLMLIIAEGIINPIFKVINWIVNKKGLNNIMNKIVKWWNKKT